MSKLLNAYLPSMEEELVEIENEIVPVSEEIESCQNDRETMDKIEIGLESLYDTLSASLKDGGLTERELTLTRLSVESYAHILGVESENLVSLESFSDEKIDNVQATAVAMESIGDVIKKIWQAIKTTIARLWNSIKDFFSKFFGGVARLKEKMVALKNKVDGVEKITEGKIEVTRTGVLQYQNKVDSKSILEGLQKTETAGNILLGDYIHFAREFYDNRISGVLKDKRFKGADTAEYLDKIKDDTAKGIAVLSKINKDIPIISGDRSVSLDIFISETSAAISNLYDIEKSIIIADSGIKKDENRKVLPATEIDKPSKNELVSLCTTTIKILTLVEKEKKAIELLQKSFEDSLKNYEEFHKEAVKGSLGSLWTEHKVKKALNMAKLDFSSPVVKYCQYSYSTAVAVGDLVNKSIA